MDLSTGIIAASAITAVASVVSEVFTASEQADVTARAADLKKQRLALQEQHRALEMSQQKAQLRRERRRRIAEIYATSAARGVTTSSITLNAPRAINSNFAREEGFLEQSAALAQRADDITRRQIDLTVSAAEEGVFTAGVSSGLAGLGTLATGVAESGVFDSSDDDDPTVSSLFGTGTHPAEQ